MDKIKLPANPNVICEDVTKLDKKDWLAARRSVNDGFTIGGSDAGTVESLSPYKTPLELYKELRNEPLAIEEKKDQTVLDRGHEYEREIAEKFCDYSGYLLIETHSMYQSKAYPWMIADFDFICADKKTGKLYGLEIKCTDAMNFQWQQDMRNGIVKPHQEYQVRQYLAISGLSSWILCLGWSAGNVSKEITNVEHVIIDRDEVLEEIMAEGQRKFINNCRAGTPPPLLDCMAEQAFEALKRVYGIGEEAEMEFDASMKGKLLALQSAESDLAVASSKKDLAEAVFFRAQADVREVMMDAKSGILSLPGGDVYRVSMGSRNTSEIREDELKNDEPKVYEDCCQFVPAVFNKNFASIAKRYKTVIKVPTKLSIKVSQEV